MSVYWTKITWCSTILSPWYLFFIRLVIFHIYWEGLQGGNSETVGPGLSRGNWAGRALISHFPRCFFLTAVGLFLLHSVSSPDCIERSWWWIHFEIYGVGGKKSLLVILLNFVVSSSQESLCCNCLHAVAHCFSSSTWKSHSTFSTIYLPTEDPSSKAQFQSYYKN